MSKKFFPALAAAALIALTTPTLHAQLAQSPLVKQSESVSPNIMYVFDDSGSMVAQAVYQYGGTAGGYGMTGPGNDVTTTPLTTFHGRSPDVNLIYYDPRITYSRRINADGTLQAPSITPPASFNVYFYNPANTLVYSVKDVLVSNGGRNYPASGVTATFNDAPVGGINATATVTTAATLTVASVAVTNAGRGYPATGTTVTFDAPPAGGIRATGTVNLVNSGNVASAPATTVGKDYPATGVTATFSAPQVAGGVNATGNVSVASRLKVSGVNISNVGAGYPATGVTVSFAAPPAGGIRATGTVDTAVFYPVGSTTKVSGGSGYTSNPTVTFSAPGGGGTTATGTVTGITFDRFRVSGATRLSGGSGYTSNPTVTITGGGGTGATATATRSGGAIASLNITNGGSGYTSTPTISITGGGGSGASFTATMAGTSGSITGINITNGGSRYSTPPTITLAGGGGTGASFTANLSSTGTVGISSITITESGSGYTSAPAVTLGNVGGGGGAVLTASTTSTNVITGISITEGGSGYTSVPTITLNNVGSGTGATFTPTLGTTRTVGSITMTNSGAGYSTPPGCTITAPSGSGATCATTAGTTYVISGVSVTNPGKGYASTPVLTLANTGAGTGATFTVNTNSTTLTGINAQWNGSGTPTTAASYFTPSYRPDAGSPLATGADTTLTYPNTADSGTSMYPKFVRRSDCAAATHCSWTEEFANYTNWYNFHRTRLDLAKTGVGLAFQPLTNTFRLGWTALSTAGSTASPAITSGVRPFDSTTTVNFINWLNGLSAPGSTPSRIAMSNVGDYFMRKDDGGPWADNPPVCNNCSTSPSTGTPNPKHVSCRRSYSIFMTDGYYNDSFTGRADVDTTETTNGAGYTYKPIGPYSDASSGIKTTNSFADVAMKYWLTDLRDDLANDIKVESTSTNPANWQHLSFNAIGLGLIGTLDSNNPDTLASLTDAPGKPRTRDWPTPAANSQRAIDDMWHATINGRGQLFNARNADGLVNSIQEIVKAIQAQDESQSGVAVSAVSLSTDTMKYTPWYVQGSWTGNVVAWHLDKAATEICGPNPSKYVDCPPAWQVETWTDIDPITKGKIYTSSISETNRNVFVGSGSTSGARAIPFDTALPSNYRSEMTGAVPVTDEVIRYLRGDASFEDNSLNKGTANAKYRYRPTRLGDIVNSTPIFVYQGAGVDYAALPNNNGFTSYWQPPVYNDQGIMTTPPGGVKGKRTEGMLFVGANDGMFHGFRNGKYDYAAGGYPAVIQPGGAESFAFIPRAILPKLNDLPSKNYAHRYYVDGPSVEVDAYINGGWKNVVLSSTGGGAGIAPNPNVNSPGTSVFAIDVTTLNSSAAASAFSAANVLWEVGSGLPATAADFAELGYVLSDVRSGPMLDDRWVAIFGNGYESKSCKAQLFVVNLATGALIKRIDTGVGNCSGEKNGLGGVTLVRNAYKQIIGAYAGDLQGNVWKFNFNSNDPSKWGLDFGGDALFNASSGTKKQPITAPPTVIDLADPNVWADGKNTAPKPGYMVVVGTGKYFETADVSNVDQQSLYGIWDEYLFGESSTATNSPRVSSSTLVQQSIGTTPKFFSAGGPEYFDSSKEAVDYTGKKGWYLNFNNSGERVTYPIDPFAYHYVVVSTIAPEGSVDTCADGTKGSGYIYVLDALWGGMPDENVLGLPDVNGMKTLQDGRNVLLQNDTNSQFRVYSLSAKKKDPEFSISVNKPVPPPSAKVPRTWRQIFIR